MSYLYITENGSVMGLDGGYFTVLYKDGTLRKIPQETLESVALFGNISLTTPCVRELLKKGVPVSYFSSNGAYFGRLESTKHNNISRLKRQIFLSENEEFSLKISASIISAKIQNQIVTLRRYAGNNSQAVEEEIKMMKISRQKISLAKSVEELIGYEGTAAKYYFSGLSEIIRKEFSFKGRNRMPPKDPFNSMISLGYTLLMHEIYGEIENKGLCAYCGFLHKDHERHPTLASDLMEEWRAVTVDSVVMSLIQGNEISMDCFVTDEESGGVFLTPAGMKIFIKKYENKLRSANSYLDNQNMSIRRGLWHQVNALTKAIENEDPDLYKPLIIR